MSTDDPRTAPVLAGHIDSGVIDSPALRGNPLGDPSLRPVYVYLPPGYDREPDRRYPSIYVIQGFTGQVDMWWNRTPYRTPFPEAADQVFANGAAPPTIVVYVDAWTAYGGSQYVDSTGTGNYHTYLCEDVIAWVDARYRTLADRNHRGIAGKSSGGFGAMITFETGSLANAARLLKRVRVCTLGESLGGVETLISHPATMTHAALGEKGRAAIGITDGMVRISVGIEDVDDILADLDQALS